MTHRRADGAARRRGELDRGRRARRVSSAIEAQRRLNARQGDGARTKADVIGPSDRPDADLTRSHD
jgi:hypothetical protein